MFPNGPATNTNHRNSEGTYAYIASALHNIDLGETLDLGHGLHLDHLDYIARRREGTPAASRLG